MSKERDMRRTDWKRITKRRYVSRGEADIFGSAGRISLTLIDEVTGPLTVHYHSRDVLIADAGYSWFQAAVPGARWWLTAMFDECDRLIQIYFDITGGSRFDDPENPTFEDMYLDIVVSADGSIEVVDRDELDEALQSGAIVRVGSNLPVKVDCRLISATNRDLFGMTAGGSFREDLLYRINTIHIDLPPLRQRREDILLLARTFLVRYAGKYRKPIRDFDAAAQHELVAHAWAGNIRELQHTVEKAVILCDGTEISPATLLLRPVAQGPSPAAFTTFEEMERAMIEQAMERHGGNLSAVAQQLGVTRQTLYNKIKRYGL